MEQSSGPEGRGFTESVKVTYLRRMQRLKEIGSNREDFLLVGFNYHRNLTNFHLGSEVRDTSPIARLSVSVVEVGFVPTPRLGGRGWRGGGTSLCYTWLGGRRTTRGRVFSRGSTEGRSRLRVTRLRGYLRVVIKHFTNST